MPEPPWTRDRGVDAVLESWQELGAVQRCIAAERRFEQSAGEFRPLPAWLSAPARRALGERQIDELYSHQVLAIEAARQGRHVVVATPTASGKSLCFHLPVIEALAADPAATALYVYPTKALSRDQEHSLLGLLNDAQVSSPAMVFDGDTPGDARRVAKERCRVVLTNPDMLHAGILPNHARWAALFQGLRYVIVDELHVYRGVFGSHLAHVLGRLLRIARFHGSKPQILGATATIGNPLEHAARLYGVPPEAVTLVDRSGAPSSEREVYLYNPPVITPELGVRESSLKHSVSLAADLIEARVPTIVFGPSRNSVEVMLKYLRERTAGKAPADSIMAYRGGYLPETRRRIEAGLRNGEILGVVATNALELGIDIGDLDAVVCAGYPGSVAATWQRFGRAGRRGTRSIAVLVCGSSALDQYLTRDPRYLFEAGAEEARIDPGNVEIVIQHLKCATFEAPFELVEPGKNRARPQAAEGEAYFALGLDGTRDALDYLAGHGLVHAAEGRYQWIGEAFPASSVSLRNIGWDNFVIIDVKTGQSIAELDYRAAHTMLHEQAIYQHDAEQYQVEKLDFENHKAFVRRVEPDYFTTALTYRTVSVLEEAATTSLGSALIGHGDVKVLERVTGYKKIKFFTHENAGYGDVHLPEMQTHTTGFWLTVPEAFVESLGVPRPLVIDALRGVGAALETVATLSLMCDPRDLGQTLGDGAESSERTGTATPAGRDPFQKRWGNFDPTVFLFDAHPGGVGLAPRIYERSSELFARAESLVEQCPCGGGCPACVGPGSENSSRKALALRLMRELVSRASPVSRAC